MSSALWARRWCAHVSCVLQDAKAKGAQVISPGAVQNWGHSTVFPSIVFPVTKAMRVMQVPRSLSLSLAMQVPRSLSLFRVMQVPSPKPLHNCPYTYIYIHVCVCVCACVYMYSSIFGG